MLKLKYILLLFSDNSLIEHIIGAICSVLSMCLFDAHKVLMSSTYIMATEANGPWRMPSGHQGFGDNCPDNMLPSLWFSIAFWLRITQKVHKAA